MGKPQHSCDEPINPYLDYIEPTTTTAGPDTIDDSLIRYPSSVPCPIIPVEECADIFFDNCDGGIYSYCTINTESEDIHTIKFIFELTEDSPNLIPDFISNDRIKRFVITLIWPASQGLTHSFPRNKIPLFSGPFSTLVSRSTFEAFNFSDEEILSGIVNNWTATNDVDFSFYCKILKDVELETRVDSEIVFDIYFDPTFASEIPQELEENEVENVNISIFASSSAISEKTYNTNHTTVFKSTWFSDFNPGNFLRKFDTNYNGEIHKYYDDCINGALNATITIDQTVDCRILQVEAATQFNRCLFTDGGVLQFANCKEGGSHNMLLTTKTQFLCVDTSFSPKILEGYVSVNESIPCDCSYPDTLPPIQPPVQPVIPPPTPEEESLVDPFDLSFAINHEGFRDLQGRWSGHSHPVLNVVIKNDAYKNTGVNLGKFQWKIVDEHQTRHDTFFNSSFGYPPWSLSYGETSTISFTQMNQMQTVQLSGYYPTPCHAPNVGVNSHERCLEKEPCSRETTLIITDIFGQEHSATARWTDYENTCQ